MRIVLILLVMLNLVLGGEAPVVQPVVVVPDSMVTVESAPAKRNPDHRYQIVGAVMMMLFFGLAIGTAESMNPQ